MALPIDHIAIACRDLDAAAARYERLGFVRGPVEKLASQEVRLIFLEPDAGSPRIELLAPLVPGEGTVGHFLEQRGEGLHHIAFRTTNLREEIERLRGEGFEPIAPGDASGDADGDGIRTGAEGARVAFLHPRSAGGVLIEIVERLSAQFQKLL